MTIPTGTLTLLQIQSEFPAGVGPGLTSGLAQSASTMAGGAGLATLSGTNLVPDISMRDFAGLSAQSFTITTLPTMYLFDGSGSTNGGFDTLTLYFQNDGLITCESSQDGTLIPPSAYATGSASDTWLTSNGTITSSHCANYDIEFTYVSYTTGGAPTHAMTWGSGSYYIQGGGSTRMNLGTSRQFSASATAALFATQITQWGGWETVLVVDVAIYNAGTNTLRSSCRITLDVDVNPGTFS